MQFYVVPALAMLFGATRIHDVSASPFGDCEPNFTKFQLFLKTDDYGYETSWMLKDNNENVVYGSGAGDYSNNYNYVFPSENEYYCLQDGECYTFIINDTNEDGICCGWAEGYYKGVLDGVLTFEGGDFGTSESKDLCVPSNVTPAPSASAAPTESPTRSPSTTTLPQTNNPSASAAPSESPTWTTWPPTIHSESPTPASDVPSMVPSNVLSLVASDVPSNVPSHVPSDAAPTESPTRSTLPPVGSVCEPNFTKFQLFLTTDDNGEETSWIIKDNNNKALHGSVFVAGFFYSNDYNYVLPSANEYYCLPDGECYTFTIYDTNADGICCGFGNGYYQGVLDDVVKFEGGQFGTSESKQLCVPSNVTPAPSASAAPTESPTRSTLSPTNNSKSPTAYPIGTAIPTPAPTNTPTKSPTAYPIGTAIPTPAPTNSPTKSPTASPITTATGAPTRSPTTLPPTNNPTNSPSNAPTSPIATNQPTTTPGPCTNSNGTVQIKKKKTTTCAKLKNESAKKKKKFCKKNAVFQACPGVCNIKCTCTDVKTFKLNGEEKKYRCKKVGKKGQPECSNILVEDVCPKTCDVCF